MSVSVAGHNEGATVLAVPETGGSITGFVLDARMNMIGTGAKIDIANSFSQVSVGFREGRVISTAIEDGSVYLHLLDLDLQNPEWVAKFPGTNIAEPAFLRTQADLIMPVVGDDGLTLYRFADSFEPIDSKHVMQTKPAVAMTSAQMGVATITAWSTELDCHIMQNATYAPGPAVSISRACPSPRIAVNQKNGRANLLFESNEGVRLMTIHATQMGGDAVVVRPDSTSPRILHDGTNFWISYLDARGDIIVGFLDAQNHLVSMSLAGPKPTRQAYELTMILGAPWIVALDSNGYTAHRMCVDAQW
jgi:hypothetical protein